MKKSLIVFLCFEAALSTAGLLAQVANNNESTSPDKTLVQVNDSAMADYNHALELDPKNIYAYINRGNARKDQGDLDGAIADYTEALKLDTKNVYLYNCRGNARNEKGDFDGALADFNSALDLDPKNAYAYNGRGRARSEKDKLKSASSGLMNNYEDTTLSKTLLQVNDSAMADYNRALELDPKNIYAYINRGNARKDQGDLDGAIADYTEALKLDTKNVYLYNCRGNARNEKGDFDGALADFNSALDLDPKNAYAYNGRGRARSEKDKLTSVSSGFAYYHGIFSHYFYIVLVPLSAFYIFAHCRNEKTPKWLVFYDKKKMPPWHRIALRVMFVFMLLSAIAAVGEEHVTQPDAQTQLNKLHLAFADAVIGIFLFLCFAEGERRKHQREMSA